MDFALKTLCWTAVVIAVVWLKDCFIDRPRMKELKAQVNRMNTSFLLCVQVLQNIGYWLTGNMQIIADELGVKLNEQPKEKDV